MIERSDSESSTVVFGLHAVETLITTRLESIDHVYIDKDKRSLPLFTIMKACRKERLAYNLVPLARLDALANRGVHQGVVAVCSAKPYATVAALKEKLVASPAPLLVLAASIEDPQNLGAIVRSCVAFRADALMLERKNTAPLSPAVTKASAGAVEHLMILRPKNLEGIVRDFAAEGFAVIGLDAAKGNALAAVDLCKPTILLMGGEHRGIPPYLEKLCTAFGRIDIDSRAQSLNVAAATAVALYECARQRAR